MLISSAFCSYWWLHRAQLPQTGFSCDFLFFQEPIKSWEILRQCFSNLLSHKSYLWGRSVCSSLRIRTWFFLLDSSIFCPCCHSGPYGKVATFLTQGHRFKIWTHTELQQWEVLEHYINHSEKWMLFIDSCLSEVRLQVSLMCTVYTSNIMNFFCLCFLFPFCFSWGSLVESCIFIGEN